MKFHKGRLKYVVPLTAVVGVSSTMMLFNRFEDVPSLHKFLIIVGAVFFAAVISYFLFPQAGDNPDDTGPY
ncbi:acyltransferase [Metasolibacillus sp. FSL H7-0170]|uniref:acyltransferase n=1 Tax=Metasolibacillus TaxID=2703677 RepID=UPI000799266D|nr:acyltransferase [Metasolibacillus fluoroglycofenilyticus]KYG89904.1 acyltransferase [[Bacillus] sp. KCTC 13219]